MDSTISRKRARMSYERARLILLGSGVGLLLMLAGLAYVGQVDPDPVEINATLLYIPIFIGFVFWDITGGVVGAVIAAAAYAALRYPALRSIGSQIFVVQMVTKSLFYFAFGVIGGWANRQLKASLDKLELYDQIDDDTGCFNARFFLQDTELEMSRSARYQTIFSVVSVDIPSSAVAPLSKRRLRHALRDLGSLIMASTRSMDRAIHACDDEVHRIAILLPETGREGARVFGTRFAERIQGFLEGRGLSIPANDIAHVALTLPEDEEALNHLREKFKEIDRSQHPEEKHGT